MMNTGFVKTCFFALPFVVLTAGASMPVTAFAADMETVSVTLDNDVFAPAEVKIPTGKPFMMKFINKGEAAAEIEAKDLKIEKVVAGKSEITVRVAPTKPGRYLFVNEYKEETVKGFAIAD